MKEKKLPLRIRLAAAIAGRKSFVPSLDLRDTLDAIDDGNHVKSYRSKSEALSANVGWAYTANDAIVKPAANVKLKLYRKMKDGEREEIFEHPVLNLMRRPNHAHTGKQQRRLHFTYMNFTGESYTLLMKGDQPFIPAKGKLPDSLHLLPAQQVEFVLGDTYSESKVRHNGKEYPITAIARDIDPDPSNPYFGQSKIAAASATIDTDEQMKNWNRRFFANNARPGLIFSTNEEMSDESYKRWKAQFADNHVGSENAYKNLLVENGDAKPYMITQQDLDFLKSREFTRDEILAMFHVSPAALGMIKDANKSIMDGAIYIHTIQNTVPRVEDYVELHNTSWIQVFDPTLELDFENPVAEDDDQKLKEAQQAVNKWMTIDEVRAEYGMEALPGGLGAQIYAESRLSPLNVIAGATEPQDKPADTNTNDDTNDDTTDDNPDDPEPPTDPPAPTGKGLVIKAEDARERQGEDKYAAYIKVAVSYEERMLIGLREQFDRMRDQILGNLVITPQPTKGYSKKDWLSDLGDWEQFDDDLKKLLGPILLDIISDTGKMAIVEVGLMPSQFNPFAQPVQDFYQARAEKISKELSDDLERQARAEISEGLKNNETTFEIRARLEAVFGANATAAADRAAQYQVSRVMSWADIQAWEQSGVVEGKEWYTAQDERVCTGCNHMHGQVLGLKEKYFSKGDILVLEREGKSPYKLDFGYEDITGCPLHGRCRCVLLPVLVQTGS